jgi:hypothetical protein
MSDTPRYLSGNFRYRTPNEAVREALEDEVKSLRSTVTELERENAVLRKDADRYRWLRDGGSTTWIPLQEAWRMSADSCNAVIDRQVNAIYAAMEKKP